MKYTKPTREISFSITPDQLPELQSLLRLSSFWGAAEISSCLWEYPFTWTRWGWNWKAKWKWWRWQVCRGPIFQLIICSVDICFTCIQLNLHYTASATTIGNINVFPILWSKRSHMLPTPDQQSVSFLQEIQSEMIQALWMRTNHICDELVNWC